LLFWKAKASFYVQFRNVQFTIYANQKRFASFAFRKILLKITEGLTLNQALSYFFIYCKMGFWI
jgi:hypothetical protein